MISRLLPALKGNWGMSLLVLAVFIAASFYAYKKFGLEIAGRSDQQVSLENVVLVPEQPEWVKSSLKEQIIGQYELDKLLLDDEELVEQFAAAFELDSHVEEVVRIEKRVNRIRVEVTYRVPVAMVEVKVDEQRFVFPVDRSAVVMQTNDFDEADLGEFLRLVSDYSKPKGNSGTPWGDPIITAGAAIANSLNDIAWKAMGLYRIYSIAENDGSNRLYYVNLKNDENIRILWGKAPGEEVSSEASVAEKVTNLEAFFKENSTLSVSSETAEIDLRSKDGVVVVPLAEATE
tara:strand:- start:881 stop:1750 length:870 start_codon:yes stop_codon:yes gene_type:complete